MRPVLVGFETPGMQVTRGVADAPDAIAKACGCAAERLELAGHDAALAHQQIEELAEPGTFFIGGDHSITYSLLRAIAKTTPRLRLVVFDAHPDLMRDFSPPTHEAYLRELLEEGVLSAEQVLLLGIRDIDPQERRFIDKQKIEFISADQLNSIEDEALLARIGDARCYLSIDIDVVDPAEAPGTGYRVPGGISADRLLKLITSIRDGCELVAADLVEVNPHRDVQGRTAALGAQLLQLLCGEKSPIGRNL